MGLGFTGDRHDRRGACHADVMISVEDYLFFVDDALDAMITMVEELGDEKANLRPDIPGTNTPFVLLTHCLGVMEFWGGEAIAGRSIVRDRQAEFTASGSVADLVFRARRAQATLARDVSVVEPFDPPRMEVKAAYSRTQGRVLVHLYRELAQHRGQMEGCRDVLLAPWARLVPQG